MSIVVDLLARALRALDARDWQEGAAIRADIRGLVAIVDTSTLSAVLPVETIGLEASERERRALAERVRELESQVEALQKLRDVLGMKLTEAREKSGSGAEK